VSVSATGVPLPLGSHGGSWMSAARIAFGLLFNIHAGCTDDD
jgi:cell division protein FtsW (lipid II flippase)